jgi:hypothetical protein
MGTFTVKKWKCDRCGIVLDGDRPNRPWGGSARYSVKVSVDYGTAGGTGIDWKEMCNDCDREVGMVVPTLRKKEP